jgi:hypothetical protein
MEKLLQTLLEDLDVVLEEHEEIGDTEVSIQMTKAIHEGFIAPRPNFVLPNQFHLFTPQANRKVRAALRRFLGKATKVAEAEGLNTPQARLAAFQNMNVFSEGGSCYNDFFGYHEHL